MRKLPYRIHGPPVGYYSEVLICIPLVPFLIFSLCSQKIKHNKRTRELIEQYNPELLLFDGLDEGIVGLGQKWGDETVVVYSRSKCIEALAKQYIEEGTEEEQAYQDAIEFFEFNVECAYIGKYTPIVITTFEDYEFE